MIRQAPDFIREQIRKTRALTDHPFGVNLVPPVAPPAGFESQLEPASRKGYQSSPSSGVTRRPLWSVAGPPGCV
jgi:hypothetical protein